MDSITFRAAPIGQIKGWLAGNGGPFASATTSSWRIEAAPFGRARKGLSAALCLLEPGHSQRGKLEGWGYFSPAALSFDHREQRHGALSALLDEKSSQQGRLDSC
jgi:hypothetical protein